MEPRSHSALRDLLPDYAADLLSPAARAELTAHLATCAECRAALAQWQTLATWLADDEAALPPDTAGARSLAAIHARLDHTPASAMTLRERNVDMPYQDDPGDLAGATQLSDLDLRPGSRVSHDSLPPGDRIPASSAGRAPRPPRRGASLLAGLSALALIALAASLFYLFAPQLRPHRTVATPAPNVTATATTGLRVWREGPAIPQPLNDVVFAAAPSQRGYFCVDVGTQIPTSSASWLYTTTDGGFTWRPVGGIPTPAVTQHVLMDCQVFVDANDASDVFAALLLLAPGPSDSGPMLPVSETLWRSRDGGASWRQLNMPSFYRGWSSLVVVGGTLVGMGTDNSLYPPQCSTDPAHPALNQVNDLVTSRDGGMTWTPIGQSIIAQGLSLTNYGGAEGPTLQVAGATMIALAACGSIEVSRSAVLKQSFWQSRDRGVTWSKLPLPTDYTGYLRVTPGRAGGVYTVAASLSDNSAGSAPAAPLFSPDGGATWQALPLLSSIPEVAALHGRADLYWITALPDGTVLAYMYAGPATGAATVSDFYAIDPRNTSSGWRLYAPAIPGSGYAALSLKLATTSQGPTLWGFKSMVSSGNSDRPVYLAPLP